MAQHRENSKGPSQKFRRIKVSLRKGSVDIDYPELGKKKLCTQELLGNSRPLKNGKSQTTQKKGRVREGEILDKVRITVPNNPNMFEKEFFRPSSNRFAAGLGREQRG